MTTDTLESVTHGTSRRLPDDALAPDVVRILSPDGTLLADEPGVSDEEAVALYRAMARTRIIDERAVLLQRQGRIGFHIGSLGEEATVLGSAYALRGTDWLFPCYREFGAALLRGMPLQRYFDNLYGNASDPAKGRQMPDHWCYRDARVGSVSSPIGTQITQAVGFAWAARIRRDPLVALVYFGEGATSSNEFHNGLNFAGVFKTPNVFLCRNNGWAISVPTERQTASESFAAKGVAYGVPAVRCDGNDVLAVLQVTRQAVERAARGEGPTLVEALTYRMSGHSTSDDPTRYRPEEQLSPWGKLDPMHRLRRYLEARVGWSDGKQQALEEQVAGELKTVIETAEKSSAPALETLFDDVFATLPWHLQEQRAELLSGPRAKGH
ncbi:MAG: thiamine pyrophosphate-dependent dehydrogenase E1 component subunit alpha [Deltaproteobacteria bacterium]|nr:thiamine pyrophosphate-dependent dehydrogenase E1 component subunit alpha [Deltaproteobacteria bacterium]